MTTPTNITSTSTPKDNLQNTIRLGQYKSTLVPDKFLNANLRSNKYNQTQYPSNNTDDESDKNSYSKAPIITERPRKIQVPQQPINFAFGSNNDYKIKTATPYICENQKITTTENNVNKKIENM